MKKVKIKMSVGIVGLFKYCWQAYTMYEEDKNLVVATVLYELAARFAAKELEMKKNDLFESSMSFTQVEMAALAQCGVSTTAVELIQPFNRMLESIRKAEDKLIEFMHQRSDSMYEYETIDMTEFESYKLTAHDND